jgi:hypothetical protein
MTRGVPMADWNGLILSETKKQLEDYRKQDIVPTVRAMFYSLVVLRVLPNTQKIYRAYDNQLSRWREKGTIPIDSFDDDIRNVIQDFDDEYLTVEEHIDIGLNYLRNTQNDYAIPRWHKQPYYVEVWLEKNAAKKPFRSIVRDRHVRVVPNSGHSSIAYFSDNVNRLKAKQAEGKKIVILYFGDVDPSGEVMDKVYKRKFIGYGLYNVEFIRLAITEKQMKRFNLLHDPDPKTLIKLKNDPNKKAFKLKYGLKSDDELFAVELEAMLTPGVRNYLKRLVLRNIDRYFDQDTYERVQSERPSNEEINAQVRTKIDNFTL